jgi:Fe-S oxidoreductase
VGALDAARKLVRKNIRVLADAIRQGYSVVTTEPAAALCLTRDYPLLVDDDDARLVAQNYTDLEARRAVCAASCASKTTVRCPTGR